MYLHVYKYIPTCSVGMSAPGYFRPDLSSLDAQTKELERILLRYNQFTKAIYKRYAEAATARRVAEVRFGPPGNAVSSPVGPHIQAHQSPLPLLEQVCWPAWKCVQRVEGPSHPGTPTLCVHPQGAPLARLDANQWSHIQGL